MLIYNFHTKRFQTTMNEHCKAIDLNKNRCKHLVYVVEGEKEDIMEIIDMYEFRDIHRDIFNEMTYNHLDSFRFKFDKYDIFKKIYKHETGVYSVYLLS